MSLFVFYFFLRGPVFSFFRSGIDLYFILFLQKTVIFYDEEAIKNLRLLQGHHNVRHVIYDDCVILKMDRSKAI